MNIRDLIKGRLDERRNVEATDYERTREALLLIASILDADKGMTKVPGHES